MPETRPYIPWDVITNFMKDAFMGYGVPERDAEICTDVLVIGEHITDIHLINMV